jgi:hypothetical protein
LTILVSFDIDGTLEAGDPPGPVTMDMVRKALAHGCIIGSCSDRPVPVQQAIWERYDISASFTLPKAGLFDLRTQFPADAYFHIGDTEIDQQYAREGGIEFLWMHVGPSEPWLQAARALAQGQPWK